MNTIGKVVWAARWAAAVATPIWWLIASSLTGGGWNSIIVLGLTVPTFLLLLIGPIVGTAVRRYRRAQAMPVIYSVFTLIQWGPGVIWPLTLTSGADNGEGPSALGTLGVPESVAGSLGVVLVVGFYFALLFALVSLIWARQLPGRSAHPAFVVPPVVVPVAPAAPLRKRGPSDRAGSSTTDRESGWSDDKES